MRNDEEETLAMAAFQTSMDEEKKYKEKKCFQILAIVDGTEITSGDEMPLVDGVALDG
jgi:hypothetical protein